MKAFALLFATIVVVDGAKLLPFQGRIEDSAGLAVTNGPRMVRFQIFDSAEATNPVWNGETHRLTVSNGLINTMLGSQASINTVDFGQVLYLEITPDADGHGVIDQFDPPLRPRQVILPPIFAEESGNARKLNGFDWSALFGGNNPTGTIDGSRISSNSIAGAQLNDQAISLRHLHSSLLTMIESLWPPGTIIAHGGKNVPDGWELCDGRSVSSTDPKYSRLFSSIQTNWGAGFTNGPNGQVKMQGTDFNLPDLRGMFLRGAGVATNFLSGSGLMDPDAAQRTNVYVGGSTGPAVGSYQLDALKRHRHTIRRMVKGDEDHSTAIFADDENIAAYNANYSGDVINIAGESVESRPKNASVQFLIKL